jgi:hypothetical protein
LKPNRCMKPWRSRSRSFAKTASTPPLPGLMTEFTVAVYRNPIEHRIRLQQVTKWAEPTTSEGTSRDHQAAEGTGAVGRSRAALGSYSFRASAPCSPPALFRHSNPRRPAWEINHRLKIQSLAFTASLECDTRTPCFQGFAPLLLKRSKTGAKAASVLAAHNRTSVRRALSIVRVARRRHSGRRA